MANLCIIPARGGSKRIPRKNIKDFLGKPIIAYSIEAALASGLFTEVMVSTDDDEIASVALDNGAKVPFIRSLENSSDFATTVDVVKEVLETYKSVDAYFHNVCVIYPTAPFVTSQRLKEGFELLNESDAVIPVVEFDYPIWRSFKIVDNNISYQWPEFEKSRSQDLSPHYHDAGQWYFIKTDKITNTLVPTKTKPLILSLMEVQDIDTEIDWLLAEMKYKVLGSGRYLV